jgi:hypothetical protein
MSTKNLRGRLDQLEQRRQSSEAKAEKKVLPFEFPIDPAVVEELAIGRQSLDKGPSHREPETPEEIRTKARMAALARTIRCHLLMDSRSTGMTPDGGEQSRNR